MNKEYYYQKAGYKKGGCMICGALCRKYHMRRHSEWHHRKCEYDSYPGFMGLSYSIVTIGYGDKAVAQTGWVTENSGPR